MGLKWSDKMFTPLGRSSSEGTWCFHGLLSCGFGCKYATPKIKPISKYSKSGFMFMSIFSMVESCKILYNIHFLGMQRTTVSDTIHLQRSSSPLQSSCFMVNPRFQPFPLDSCNINPTIFLSEWNLVNQVNSPYFPSEFEWIHHSYLSQITISYSFRSPFQGSICWKESWRWSWTSGASLNAKRCWAQRPHCDLTGNHG